MANQPVEFPFVAGQDEGANAKVLSLPRLTKAINARCLKQNQFRKIRGTAAIGTATVDTIGVAAGVSPVGPVRVFVHDDQLIVCGEESAFTLSEATSPSKLEEIEDLTEVTVPVPPLPLGHYGARDVASCSVANTGTFTVYAWFSTQYTAAAVTDYQLHVMTVDNATGAGSAGTLVTVASTDANNINPGVKAIALGSKVTVFWGETVSGVNRIRYLDVTSATQGPYLTSADNGTNLVSGGIWGTAQFFDVAEHNGGYVLAYEGGSGLTFARYNASHALQSTAAAKTITGTDARVGVVGNMDDNSATWHMAIVTDNSDSGGTFSHIEVYGMADDCSTVHTYTDTSEPYCIGIAFGEFDGTRSHMVYGVGSPESPYAQLKYFANGALVTQSGIIPSAYVCGKPIGRDGQSYFCVQFRTSQANSAACLVRIDPGLDGAPRSNLTAKLEATFNRGQGVSELSTGTATNVDAAGSVSFVNDVLKIGIPIVDRYSGPITAEDPTGDSGDGTTDVVVRIGADAHTFAFGERDRFQTCRVGGYTFLGGGLPLQFDGKRLVEIGFAGYPDVSDSDLVAATSGGNLADGTYSYAFCWEWVDYLGNAHQSAYKFASATVSGGSGAGKVTITAPPGLGLTLKTWRIHGDDGRPIVLAIYRSVSSEETGATTTPTLHRLEGPGVAAFLENDMNEATSIGTFVDTYNSTTILLVTRELARVSSAGANELDNVPPPPARFLVAHDDRVIGINDMNPAELFYTKQIFKGSGTAWNESLVIPLEDKAKQLASQDGNLVVFCRDPIYTVIGRPADNTGQSTGYEPPQRLSTELGCTNPRSVCVTPAGTFFESDRGIYVLPRGGAEAQFIGKPVEDTLALYPTITDACHVPGESTVLFSCVDQETTPATAAGRVLAYQYDIGQWFVREYASKPVSSMVVQSGNVVFGIYESASSWTLWREDSGFDDAEGNYVGITLETGDIRLGGMGGNHSLSHIILLGERLGSCIGQVREKVDGGDYDVAESWVLTTAETELARWYQTHTRKASVHRFEYQETQFSTVVDTEGLALTGLTLWGSPLGGSSRLADQHRA